MTVFERIEELRKSKKISQGKLEKELGFSNGSISKWKTSMPNSERLQKLADYFDVSSEYLMTGKESIDLEQLARHKKEMNSYAQKWNSHFLGNKLMESFSELSDTNKKKVLSYSEGLLNLQEQELELMPNAAHDKGATEEQKKHADDIMDNDDLWK